MWSSYTVKPYLRVTVHFVTEDFNLKAPCFQIAYFPQATTHDHRRPHRGKYCSRPKRGCARSWWGTPTIGIQGKDDCQNAGTGQSSLIPTWQVIEVLESIHKVLHLLFELTNSLSGEAYISISFLKPFLHLLATSFLTEDVEDTDLTRSIKTKVLA
ncbi:Cadherin EGF LAG seven-pass G-type receptor 3 [Labeo rohita]|uniref:Cadherin EGF LAG seven-pass G-type receptor 3 n=1 Tax=Labeo rohita TaxID=84645 RepID=A0ABQ8MFR6_LABRO|nr:Cadherin EGF LAG seven-pass G-type receptor 3 [Labeo rohita]